MCVFLSVCPDNIKNGVSQMLTKHTILLGMMEKGFVYNIFENTIKHKVIVKMFKKFDLVPYDVFILCIPGNPSKEAK